MSKRTTLLWPGLGLILLLTLGVTPRIIGLNLRESTVSNLIALIPPETLRQLEINETASENGWFGSTAEFQVDYLPLGADAPITLNLAFDFDHGPVMLTGDGMRFGLAHADITPTFDSREITEALASVPFELPQLNFGLLAGFDQSLTLQLSIAPANISEPSASVTFNGLTGTLRSYRDLSADFQLIMGSLAVQQPASATGFTLEGLSLKSQTQQMNDVLAPSTTDLNIPVLSAVGPLAFSASDINANSRLQASMAGTDHIDVYQRLQVAEIDSELPLEALGWTLEINELSTQLIRSNYDLLSSLQEQINTGGAGSDALNAAGEQLSLVLVRNSLIVNNFLTGRVYGGDHSLDVLTRWQGLPQTGNINELALEDIVAALQLQVSMSLDLESILRSPLADIVDPYVQQGYIQLSNGRIMMMLTLADSELILNGSSTPLQQFFPAQNI